MIKNNFDVHANEYELRDQGDVGSGAHRRGAIFGLLMDGADLHLDKTRAIELRDFLTKAIDSAEELDPEEREE
jgi:hypothetical protein